MNTPITRDVWHGLAGASPWTPPRRAPDHPWECPPPVTPEMEALANAWDAGGRELIFEVEI